ncbi:MAG: sensor histidine kinase [Steroidobacteraceae bacterium]
MESTEMQAVESSARPAPILPVTWQRGEYRTVLIIIAVCCWCSAWYAVQHQGTLVGNLITSNSIGLTQWTLSILVRLFFRGRLPTWGSVLAVLAGIVIGAKLASLTGVPDIVTLAVHHPQMMRQTMLEFVTLGAAIWAFFLYVSHSRGVREELERERRRAAEALQAETAARLALLQAQIEPHFLFNTLANIHSLIAEDPNTASLVLEELNAYLRTSLRRTRRSTGTLGEEIELIERLLTIAAARLGRRLHYTVSVPQELRSYELPPLLVQPLVENALRHGIEPAVEGGAIQIDAREVGDSLELAVADTGVGLNDEAPAGVGLANIRARLASLYGGKGTLALYANVPHGVIAKLRIPSSSPGAAS